MKQITLRETLHSLHANILKIGAESEALLSKLADAQQQIAELTRDIAMHTKQLRDMDDTMQEVEKAAKFVAQVHVQASSEQAPVATQVAEKKAEMIEISYQFDFSQSTYQNMVVLARKIMPLFYDNERELDELFFKLKQKQVEPVYQNTNTLAGSLDLSVLNLLGIDNITLYLINAGVVYDINSANQAIEKLTNVKPAQRMTMYELMLESIKRRKNNPKITLFVKEVDDSKVRVFHKEQMDRDEVMILPEYQEVFLADVERQLNTFMLARDINIRFTFF
jgi:chromosome segregation ATPase